MTVDEQSKVQKPSPILDKIISVLSNKQNEKRKPIPWNSCYNRKRKLSETDFAPEPSNNNKRRRICRCHEKVAAKNTTRSIQKNNSRKSLINKRVNENNNKESNKPFDYLAQFGKNFCCHSLKKRTGLRPIYIDGTNVACSHGQNGQFSVKGLKICIDYFLNRGHEVKAFIPNFRLRKHQSTDQKLLHQLVRNKHVIVTPTLYIKNQQRSPYDDWYIVQSAAANGGIIVSGDNFQDIIKWNPNLRVVAEEQKLVPTFVDDMLIFPMDPHGNRQNNLEQFLKF